MGDHRILGFREALKRVLETVAPVGPETIDLKESIGRVSAKAVFSAVDSPSVNASRKEGYAVQSGSIEGASPDRPVRLRVTGTIPAGDEAPFRLDPGTGIRILTGAKIPENADAVLSGEFAVPRTEGIDAIRCAEPGRNILRKGSDIRAGEQVARPGQILTPGRIGFLTAAGCSEVTVFRKPGVELVATGDEVVAPGEPLPEGKLYASNLAALNAWCRYYGFRSRMMLVPDDPRQIARVLEEAVSEADAVLTSGGAWTGDRDMVAGILDQLRWRRVFHRIRIGPGKAVGFGLLRGKPVFLLPGGPPSNLMAFLQIALPGLLKLSGRAQTGLPRLAVRLGDDLRGRSADWTQFLYGRIEQGDAGPVFHPLRGESRLRDMAEAEAVVSIPEGETLLSRDRIVMAQWLG
jgi:molybdopterin molybdotransferase